MSENIEQNIEQLWNEFHLKIGNFIKTKVSNSSDSEDILQELFLKIQKQNKNINEIKNIQAWLYRMVSNLIIDYYRKSKKHNEFTDEINFSDDKNLNDNSIEINECIIPFLTHLNDKDQEIINLIDMQGLKQNFVAKKLNLSLSATKSRIQRARKRLKKLFTNCCSVVRDVNGKVIELNPKKHGCDSSCNCKNS